MGLSRAPWPASARESAGNSRWWIQGRVPRRGRRLSFLDREHVRLNLPFDRSSSKPALDRLRGDRGYAAEPGCVSRLDLVAEWRSLTESDCRVLVRRRSARERDRLDGRRGDEPPGRDVAKNGGRVVVPVRDPSKEGWGIGWELRRDRDRDGIGEIVLLDPVPHVEQKKTTSAEDATCLSKRARFFREEHRAELADDRIELTVPEGQLHRIGLAPRHWAFRAPCDRSIHHALVQVGGLDGDGLWQRGGQLAGDHSRARRNLQNARQRPR